MGVVAVTGASGFVGRFVVDALRPHHDVKLIDIIPPNHSTDLEFVRTDIREIQEVERAFAGVTHVVHMAAIVRDRAKRPLRDFADVFVLGTWNVFEAAVRNEVKRIVNVSSIIATGQPEINPASLPTRAVDPPHFSAADIPNANLTYSLGKYLGEQIASAYSAAHGIESVVIRPGVVAGDGMNGQPSRPQEPEPYWFMYVHPADLAQAIAKAVLAESTPTGVYNIVAGRTDSRYDWEPARVELGYKPTNNWNEL